MLRTNDLNLGQEPLLLMLDYDGTLTPIVSDFHAAQIGEDGLSLLKHVAGLPKVQLAVVSGRSVSQLLTFLSVLKGQPIYLVGLHGGELYNLASETYLVEPAPEYKHGIHGLKRTLVEQGILDLSGIQLEDKGFSLGVHFNLATEETALQAMEMLKAGLHSRELMMDFILRPGKKLLEAVPKGFNKGVGVEELIPLAAGRFNTRPHLVYIGDDITDFDAFRMVNLHRGDAIFVGASPPEAAPKVAGTLPDVAAVYSFLHDLIAQRSAPVS